MVSVQRYVECLEVEKMTFQLNYIGYTWELGIQYLLSSSARRLENDGELSVRIVHVYESSMVKLVRRHAQASVKEE